MARLFIAKAAVFVESAAQREEAARKSAAEMLLTI
jgi:hypothetical protein